MIASSAKVLALSAALALVLALVHDTTRLHIEANREAARWTQARQLSGQADLTGPWVDGQIELGDARYLALTTAAGYGGDIELILHASAGKLLGVAVVRHAETPGIGDFIERSDGWMADLINQGPHQVEAKTGATITSRALTQRITEALER